MISRLWAPPRSPPPPQSTSVLSASVSSRDVERQFARNPQGSFSFTVGAIGYRLDFSSVWCFRNTWAWLHKLCVCAAEPNWWYFIGSHEPNKLQLRDAQGSTQATEIQIQHNREVRFILSFLAKGGFCSLCATWKHHFHVWNVVRTCLRSLYATSGLLSASSSQLSDGGFRWEFMGDEGVWTEYQAHVSNDFM